MKRNIIGKILFTFICMFMLLSTIIAEDVTGTGSGGTGGAGTNIGTSGLSSNQLRSSNHLAGIRISFYRSNGQQISSKDYIVSKMIKGNSAYTQYGNGTPCGKVSHCEYKNEWMLTSNFSNVNTLTSIFSIITCIIGILFEKCIKKAHYRPAIKISMIFTIISQNTAFSNGI